MRKKLVSIILSIMVAVTFMPLAADCSFAVEGNQNQAVQQPVPPSFNPKAEVGGIKVSGYTYKSVYITWTGVSQAKGYKVYRASKKKGKYKLAATTGATGFNDKKNKSLGRYKYYKIRPYGTVNGKTVYGPYSSVFRAKPKIPAASGLRTAGSSEKITLAWNKVAGAKKYQVYRATSINGKYKKLTTTKKCSYAKAATTGQRYYFKVRALRGSRKSSYSAKVEGLAMQPAPASVSASQSGEGIRTSWAGVAQSCGYEVYRAESANGSYKYLAGVTGTSFMDTQNLVDGQEYFYKVRAIASVNGTTQAGAMSSNTGASRNAVINLARSYKGIAEKSTKHKDIVNTYNNYVKSGKIGYSDAWCAAFVSAIEIKSGNASLIPIGAYCPTMMSSFKSKTSNKSYHPNTADVIFFDWNANKVPDHVGFVDNYNSSANTVTTIEGNYSDTVKCRTFKPGYTSVLAYGLPAYPDASGVVYEAPEAPSAEINAVAAEVTQEQVQEVSEQALNPEAVETETPESEKTEAEAVAEIPETDYDKVVAVAEVVQEEQPAEEVITEESTFDAFLVQEVCEDMGIQACVITEIDANGEMSSYNEIIIDGQIYVLDASEETVPEEFVPETIN